MAYNIEVLRESKTVKKIRVIKTGAERVKYFAYLVVLVIVNVFFFGGMQSLLSSVDEMSVSSFFSINGILGIVLLSNFFLFFAIPFFPLIYSFKDFLFNVTKGDIYELNKEKDSVLINEKHECAIRDLECLTIRIYDVRFGKNENRLYFKFRNGSKRAIQQSDNYEELFEIANNIAAFLDIGILVK